MGMIGDEVMYFCVDHTISLRFTFGGDFEGDFEGDLDVFFGILFSPIAEGIFSPSLFGGDGLFGCLEVDAALAPEVAVFEGPAS